VALDCVENGLKYLTASVCPSHLHLQNMTSTMNGQKIRLDGKSLEYRGID
jgi:hypothetical protein